MNYKNIYKLAQRVKNKGKRVNFANIQLESLFCNFGTITQENKQKVQNVCFDINNLKDSHEFEFPL